MQCIFGDWSNKKLCTLFVTYKNWRGLTLLANYVVHVLIQDFTMYVVVNSVLKYETSFKIKMSWIRLRPYMYVAVHLTIPPHQDYQFQT